MSFTSARAREARPQWSPYECSPYESALDLMEPQRRGESGRSELAPPRDVLELMLLHGDCAFLLDLQEL